VDKVTGGATKVLVSRRRTPQAGAILEAMSDGRPMTKEAIFERARRLSPGLSFWTVHRTIRSWLDEGRAKILMPNRAALYVRADIPSGSYLGCRKCDRLEPVMFKYPDEVEYNRVEGVYFIGVCRSCRRADGELPERVPA